LIGSVALPLRVLELRNRDRGEDADDHDHDEEFDEGETGTAGHGGLGRAGGDWEEGAAIDASYAC
jgi:hypothetical protein